VVARPGALTGGLGRIVRTGMNDVAPFEVGFVVSDIDAMLRFYQNVLGFALLTDITMPATSSRAAALSADGYRVVRLASHRGDRLKLARPTSPGAPTPATDYMMQPRGGAYVTFIVDDLPALHERLRRAGARIASEGVVDLRPGVTMMLATDPEHNWLEFVHYDDLAAYQSLRAKP
jgi:catechol 2,3-dioxygenase-like lactoylglutathione lyase family enzyme